MNRIIRSLFGYLKPAKETGSEKDILWAKKIDGFFKIIGYHFQNQSLIKAALTHNSYLRKIDSDSNGISPFERMEFLGDSILGLIVAEELFIRFPDKKEGTLSKMKSKIVSEKYLAMKAKKIRLGDYLLLSEEEEGSGGKNRKSILSDAMESLICAIYLDGNFEVARKFIHKTLLENFEKDILSDHLKNYKSILQEYTQSLYQNTPEYKLIKEIGPDHLKIFHIEVFINQEKAGYGEGKNKKEAQQNAARNACKKLGL